MATRKMTFTLPEDVAAQLLRRVPPRERSRYVSQAIATKLRERTERLIRACEVANRDPDILALERDWGALPGDIKQPWNDTPSR